MPSQKISLPEKEAQWMRLLMWLTSRYKTRKKVFYSTFSGGHICRPAWLRKNKFLIVETERGILCCSHSEGLEGPPGELSLLFLDEITKLIPIFLNRRRFILKINSFQDVRRKVQKSKSKQSLSKKANNGKQIKVKSAWDNCWSVDTQKRIPPLIFEPHWVLVEGTTENLSDLTKSSFVGDILLNDVKKWCSK